jgi:hypothetical protein
MIVALSFLSNFQVRLPSDNENGTYVHLIVHIRDELDCVTKYNVSSTVIVKPDLVDMMNLFDAIENASDTLPNDRLTRLISTGNQNFVGQLMISLSQHCNRINDEMMIDARQSNRLNLFNLIIVQYRECAICFILFVHRSDGLPFTSIYISSLTDQYASQVEQTQSCLATLFMFIVVELDIVQSIIY